MLERMPSAVAAMKEEEEPPRLGPLAKVNRLNKISETWSTLCKFRFDTIAIVTLIMLSVSSGTSLSVSADHRAHDDAVGALGRHDQCPAGADASLQGHQENK